MRKLALVFVCLLACSCTEVSRADRIRYGLKMARTGCTLAEVYPNEVPPELEPELTELCPILTAPRVREP